MARSLALALTAAASLTLAAVAAPLAVADPLAVATPGPGRAQGDRALTYAATARYQVHANAVADGYKPDQYCVVDKAGPGALGYPHFNHKYDNSSTRGSPPRCSTRTTGAAANGSWRSSGWSTTATRS